MRDKLGKLDADISSDMFLRLALMRRGLALDQANILDYLVHDLWVERIFDVRTSDQPDGYSQVSHQQVINADKRLFVKLAEMTRGGIQLQASGRPTDSAFRRAMEHPDVNHLLQPLPKRLASVKEARRCSRRIQVSSQVPEGLVQGRELCVCQKPFAMVPPVPRLAIPYVSIAIWMVATCQCNRTDGGRACMFAASGIVGRWTTRIRLAPCGGRRNPD